MAGCLENESIKKISEWNVIKTVGKYILSISNIYLSLYSVEIFYLINFFMIFFVEMNKFIIQQILGCHTVLYLIFSEIKDVWLEQF